MRRWWTYVTSTTRSWSRCSRKYEGRVVLRGDVVTDDSGSLYSVHGAGFVSITNDGCKSSGCFCQATRMRWASERRSICLHPSQNGRRPDTVKKHLSVACPDMWIRLPRYKWPKGMAEYRRTSGSSGKESIGTHPGRICRQQAIRDDLS